MPIGFELVPKIRDGPLECDRARSDDSSARLAISSTGTPHDVTALRRRKAFKVWLVDEADASIHRADYRSTALPSVGEMIVVRKMTIDADGSWRPTKAKPVAARVTRIRGGMITAALGNDAESYRTV